MSPPNAVVIGAGFGGIAAALRLRAKGFAVSVYDRCQRLGGRAQQFARGGFRHDAGPTVITAPFLFDELFELFGENRADNVEFKPLPLWYRFQFDDGSTFDYGEGIENTLEQIGRISPEDQQGYLRLLNESKKIYEVGFEGLADQPFHELKTMLSVLPDMARLRVQRSVWDLVCSHLQHDKLRQAFSIQPLLVGGNPFDTTCIYNLIHYLERQHGVYFSMGGTAALVDALEDLMVRQGIEIHTSATVREILCREGRVHGLRLEDGHVVEADLVVANADPAYVYEHMLPDVQTGIGSSLKSRFATKSMGLYVLYFGTTKQYEDVAHHTICLGPRYKGLLDDIFHNQILADDFSLYLHRPTATDPSFAPAGCDSFYALVPVPNLEADIDWKLAGSDLRNKCVEALEKYTLPGLSDCIVEDFWMTPKDFETNYLSPAGAGFSIAPSFTQSAWFRFHNKAEVDGLYFVGAGTHPGAGLPGVLSSAKVLDALLDHQLSERADVVGEQL